MKHSILLFISFALFFDVHASDTTDLNTSALQSVSPIALEVPDLTHVDEAPRFNRARSEAIQRWWSKTCPEFEVQKVPRFRQGNIICRVQGELDEVIVVGAHYDKVSDGHGVADNWSGVVIIDALLRSFVDSKPRYTIDFVAFAAEEPGLFGSRAYVARRTRATRVMLNIDTIGLTDLIIAEESDSALVRETQNMAKLLDIPLSVRRWKKVSGDWEPFASKGVSVLSLHSVNRKTIRRIHHRRDKAGNVDLDKLGQTYRLAYHLIQHWVR